MRVNFGRSAFFLASLSMLTAIQVVLSRFVSIETPIFKIGFGFVPVMISGALFGPLGGLLVGGLSDFLGAMLFPFGAYFPGYTITAAFSGAIYGCFFYRRTNLVEIVIAYLITTLTVTLGFNTLFVAILYTKGDASLFVKYLSLLPTRLLQAAIMLAVQVVITYFLIVKGNLYRRLSHALTPGKHWQ